jgi:hypothetical protein
MSDTPTVKSIYECIIDFQSQMPIIKKTENNPFFKSKYADLANIQSQIREPLAKSGLGYIQITTETGLETRLFTKTGETIFFNYPVNLTGKAQEIGSSITYAKRYSLVALLGIIVDGDDDDGNDAQNQKPITKIQAKKTVETLHPELWQAITDSQPADFDNIASQLFKIQNDDENRKQLWFKLANHAKKHGFEYSKETKQFFKITE